VAKSPLYASKTAQAAFALNAPDFGWHYVRFWLDAQLNLPSMVNQHSIYLMFMHFAGCLIKDELPQTLELREPNSTFTRIAVEAYSLCRDLQMSQIPDRVKIREQVLRIYYDLFFNVRNRFDEPLYVAQIVYPETRLADLRADGFDPQNIRQNLFRIAYEYGSEALECKLGTRIRQFSPAVIEKLAAGLEGRIMSNARTVARLGGLNSQQAAPALRLATGLLRSMREQGQPPNTFSDDVAGLGAVGLCKSVLDTMLRMQKPEIERRLDLLRAEPQNAEPQVTPPTFG
jgi:hypothetical protein